MISLVFLIAPLATARYALAIPLPRNDGLGIHLVFLNLILLVIISSLGAVILLLFGKAIFSYLNYSELESYIWIIIVGNILIALNDIMANWSTRKKTFNLLSKTRVLQTFFAQIIKISLGLAGFKPGGLLIGGVVQNGAGGLILLTRFILECKKSISRFHLGRILFLAKYYYRFPLLNLPAQLLQVLSVKLPILYFAYQFGQDTTGQLGLAISVIAIPVGVFGISTGKAYYGEISEIGNKKGEDILQITSDFIKKISLMAIFPAMLLLVFAPVIFPYIFGAGWYDAGKFTSVLSIYLFFQFVSLPLTNIYNVFNKQNVLLKLNALRFMLISCVFLISFQTGTDAYQTLLFYSLVLSLFYVINIVHALNILRKI